jgi:ribonuclease E
VTTEAELATETVPESPDGQTPEGTPEGTTGTKTGTRRRRSRGGRGRSKAKPAGETAEAADADGQEPAPKRRSTAAKTTTRKKTEQPKRAKAEPKTEESERGAPTRLRRQRQGRTTVRRRRESMPIVPRVTDKLMVITQHGERDQIAVLEERELVQHYVTRAGARSMVGNVYLGRVQNVLPGMEAAFVDVGRGRNAVLYAGEVNWSPEDLEGAAPRIEHVLKNGQSVLVQVTKDPIGGKGARLTAQISLPGRFLVLAPNSEVSGISRRLPDAERRRLKTFVKNLKPGVALALVTNTQGGACCSAGATRRLKPAASPARRVFTNNPTYKKSGVSFAAHYARVGRGDPTAISIASVRRSHRPVMCQTDARNFTNRL